MIVKLKEKGYKRVKFQQKQLNYFRRKYDFPLLPEYFWMLLISHVIRSRYIIHRSSREWG